MSVEEAIRHLKRLPEFGELIKGIYADDDVVIAALRFARSEEFRCVAQWAVSEGNPPPARVLDLGAGRGIASLAWALRGYSVTALEPDTGGLVGTGAIRELARRTRVPIEIVETAGENIPLEGGSVDIVYTRQALHHAANLRAVCAEMARVLRPGGLCIATREHVVSDHGELEQFWQNHPVHQLAGGEMAYERREYSRALSLAGLTRVKAYGPWDSPVNYYPIGVEQAADLACESAIRRFGVVIGPRLASTHAYRWLWGRLRSTRDKTPGRMFSFVASRPMTSGGGSPSRRVRR